MGTRILPLTDPDTEAMVIRHLNAGLVAPYKAVADLPAPDRLPTALPLVQVIGSFGSADSDTTVYDRVDVYCMAASRAAVRALTLATHDLMRTLGGAEVDGQLIDVTRTIQRPSRLDWSPTVPRTIAVYEIQYRPRPV